MDKLLLLLAIMVMTAKRSQLKADTPYKAIIEKYAIQFSLDPCLIAGLIKKENVRFNPTEIASDGLSYGLVQMKLSTARQFEPNTVLDDLFNPDTAIRLACKYLAWAKKSGVPLPNGVSCYNTGVEGYFKGVPPIPPNYSDLVIFYAKGFCYVSE